MDYDIDNIRLHIQQDLDGPGCSGGYRTVWHTLKMEGIQVPRDIVRVVLKELDPQGVEERRLKTLCHRAYHTPGPNYSWHVHGYDKLKLYGLEGYSCKVLWLKVSRTNNDPNHYWATLSQCSYRIWRLSNYIKN